MSNKKAKKRVYNKAMTRLMKKRIELKRDGMSTADVDMKIAQLRRAARKNGVAS
jgi:hypothetical protein